MIDSSIQRILDLVFRKYTSKSGHVVYYRECCLEDARPDEQGYLWVFEDGETLHSYRTPDSIDN